MRQIFIVSKYISFKHSLVLLKTIFLTSMCTFMLISILCYVSNMLMAIEIIWDHCYSVKSVIGRGRIVKKNSRGWPFYSK